MGCAEWVSGPVSKTFSSSTWDVVKMILGELLGTAILCFLGISTCLKWTNAQTDTVQIAFGFGLAIAGVIYMMGPISGAHINPSITVASMITGRINVTKGIMYIASQCVGGIVGSGLLWLIQVDDNLTPGRFGLTLPNPKMTSAQALCAEILITMIFVLVFLSVTDPDWSYVKGSASLAIGFTATTCHLGYVNATGTSMNPARSLGPAVIMAHFEYLWIYLVGPITGAILAAFLYTVLIYVPKEVEVPEPPVDDFTATGDDDVTLNSSGTFTLDEVFSDAGPNPVPLQNPTYISNY